LISRLTNQMSLKIALYFFDDRQVNVDGARAAGMPAELFTTTNECHVILQKYKILD
jgi:hypothetical protein